MAIRARTPITDRVRAVRADRTVVWALLAVLVAVIVGGALVAAHGTPGSETPASPSPPTTGSGDLVEPVAGVREPASSGP